MRIIRFAAAALAVAALALGTGRAALAADARVIEVAQLANPVGFTFTPNGRVVYLERESGEVRFLSPRTGVDRLFFRIGGVNSDGERGALGVALHPAWPSQPFVYVYVTRAFGDHPLQNQLVRIRDSGGRGTGMKVLLRSPIGARSNHNGGRIRFGPDGKLYVVIGDGGEDPSTAQDLSGDEPRGKILRLNPNGSVPATNPIADNPLWSYGHRNSIGFAFDPQTGSLWETENGPDCNDEVNLVVEGGNAGWGSSQQCGIDTTPLDTNRDGPDPKQLPAWWFEQTIAITGAAFCDGCGLGPSYEGDLLFGCANGNCKATVGPLGRFDLNGARDALSAPAKIRTGFAGPVYSMEVAPNGRIWFSDYRGIYRLAPA
jgi:glucose/arabinose dehydrogenase